MTIRSGKNFLTDFLSSDNMYTNNHTLSFIKSSRGNGPMTLRQPPIGIGAKSSGVYRQMNESQASRHLYDGFSF